MKNKFKDISKKLYDKMKIINPKRALMVMFLLKNPTIKIINDNDKVKTRDGNIFLSNGLFLDVFNKKGIIKLTMIKLRQTRNLINIF